MSLFIAIMIACGGMTWLSTTKHSTGFERRVHVPNDLPRVQLYWDMAGVESKIWWDMSTVQDRAKLLADIYGYEGDDIACSANGNWLYIGVD